MNILEIIIIVAFLLFAAAGFRSGFVKKLASMVALVLSVILVAFFLPYITGFLRDNTPVYDMITEQCRRVVAEQTAGLLTGTQETEESGGTPALDREQIKSLLEANGYDSSIVDSLSDEQLQSYVQQYAQDYLQQNSEGGQDTTAAEPGRLEQMEIISQRPAGQVLGLGRLGGIDLLGGAVGHVDGVHVINQLHHLAGVHKIGEPAAEFRGKIEFSVGKRPRATKAAHGMADGALHTGPHLSRHNGAAAVIDVPALIQGQHFEAGTAVGQLVSGKDTGLTAAQDNNVIVG